MKIKDNLSHIVDNTVPADAKTPLCTSTSAGTVLTYPQTSNIRDTKSQKLNISRLVLQLSLPNPLKPGVKSRMKM